MCCSPIPPRTKVRGIQNSELPLEQEQRGNFSMGTVVAMTTKLEFSTHWKSSHLGPVHTRMPCRKGAFHAPRAERIAFAICCGRQYIYLIDQKPNKFDTAQMPQSVTPADRPQCLQVLVRLNTCSSDTLRITTK